LGKNFRPKNIDISYFCDRHKKFVRQNQFLDIKINILCRELDGKILPFECGIGEGKQIINLLMVEKSEKISDKWISEKHFLAIKNVNKYLSTTYTNDKGKSPMQNVMFV